MARPEFINGEFYHIFTHGVESRNLFNNALDYNRFLEAVVTFNDIKPSQSLFTARLPKHADRKARKPLVNIIAYCLNPNHYHMILEQTSDNGISEFIKRINGGHAQYYNLKYKRRGTLFEGKFKAKHIHNNEYLLSVSAYVNLNYKIHGLSSRTAQFRSSWDEYTETTTKHTICVKDIINNQFENVREYKNFAEETVAYLRSLREPGSITDLLIERE